MTPDRELIRWAYRSARKTRIADGIALVVVTIIVTITIALCLLRYMNGH